MSEIELPAPTLVYEHKPTGLKIYHYTAEQARQAVLAERERCARVCEEVNATTGECPEMALYCAAAIRRG